MVHAYAEWQYDQLHEKKPYHDGSFPTDPKSEGWSAKRSESHPFHYRDGITLWVAETDLTPHDHFLGDTGKCAECSPSTP